MKVLFANCRRLHPFGIGGDTVSAYAFLDYLSGHGCTCSAIGSLSHPEYITFAENLTDKLGRMGYQYGWSWVRREWKIVRSGRFPNIILNRQLLYRRSFNLKLIPRDFLFEQVRRDIESEKPDIVFTQMEGADDIINIATAYGKPILLFVYDVEVLIKKTLKRFAKNRHVSVVFPSRFALRTLNPYLGNKHYFIHQPVDQAYFECPPSRKTFITMINPVPEKGSAVIERIIQKLPEKKFLLVEGWKRFRDLKTDYSAYPNVTMLPRQDDLLPVLARTKFILVPSLWEECIPRVATEAMAAGIPVIGSIRGGIPEAVGRGGILIRDYMSIPDWITAIRKLDDDDEFYERLSLQARKHAMVFHVNRAGEALLSACKDSIGKNAAA